MPQQHGCLHRQRDVLCQVARTELAIRRVSQLGQQRSDETVVTRIAALATGKQYFQHLTRARLTRAVPARAARSPRHLRPRA